MDHINELRNWWKEDEGYKKWMNLEVDWVHHHNPELFITNSKGEVKEQIDMNGYTVKKIEDLLKRKG